MSDEKKACRDSWWSELDADDRVKRLRQIVKGPSYQIKLLQHQMEQLLDHLHGPDGKIAVPLNTHRGFKAHFKPLSDATGGDDVYF